MKCYVDSNVFIALIFDESGKNFNLMSYFSEEFFKKSIEGKHELIISNLVIKEFCKITRLTEDEFTEFVNNYCGKIKIVNITLKDKGEANKINNEYHTGFADSFGPKNKHIFLEISNVLSSRGPYLSIFNFLINIYFHSIL